MAGQILSCDWGTSSFRLRLVNCHEVNVLSETRSAMGIAEVYHRWLESGLPETSRIEFYQSILQSQIQILGSGSLTGIPLIISGMASSSMGIAELAYGKIPFSLSSDKLLVRKIPSGEKFLNDILLVSGLRTDQDVMRGEETMLLGCEIDDDKEQLFLFPGTHSKHVQVSKKKLMDVKTYMTGELFDLLVNKSILANSIIKDESEEYHAIFQKGVQEGTNENLLNSIFHIRTNFLFKTATAEENYHYLSGLVIGSELKQITSKHGRIHLVCSQGLMTRYRLALETILTKNELQYTDADKALLTGHCKLANSLL